MALHASQEAAGSEHAGSADRESGPAMEINWQALVDAIDGHVYICSPDRRILFTNRHMQQRIGHDAVGHACHKALHNLDGACDWCPNDRVSAGETVRWQIQSPLDNHWYDVTTIPLPNPDGTICKQSIMMDITEHKEREREFGRLAALLDETQALARVGGWELETADSHLQWTDETYRIFEVSPRDYVPAMETFIAFCTRDHVSLLRDSLNAAVEHGVEFSLELRVKTARKRTIWVEMACRVVMEEGRTVRILGSVKEITRRKQEQEALVEKTRQLNELNETLEQRVFHAIGELREKDRLLLQQSRLAAMGEMINNIAHQWRQPLNTLGLHIQRLKLFHEIGKVSREFMDTSTGDAMKIIRHMSQTIDDFRNFFKPEKEKVEFAVRQAVQQTVSLAGDSFRSGHVEIQVLCDGEPRIFGYPNEFSQVLLNILQNARETIKERGLAHGLVQVTAAQEDRTVVVTITDNAGGIPAEIIDRIFEPYFSTRGVHGTGIGLFMSKTIIENNMGGRITAANTDRGACFRIELAASGGC